MSTDPVYRVVFLSRAERLFRKLPIQAQQRLSGVIDQLALDPRPQTSKVKALSGGEGLLRWREGQYRLVYRIDDTVLEVLVVQVGHRREVYERQQWPR